MKRLSLSRQAHADLENIASNTLKLWGEKQLVKYTQLLDLALEKIGENPEKGRSRKDVPEGYLYCHAEHHFIFYKIEGQSVDVVRILHEKMNFSQHLS